MLPQIYRCGSGRKEGLPSLIWFLHDVEEVYVKGGTTRILTISATRRHQHGYRTGELFKEVPGTSQPGTWSRCSRDTVRTIRLYAMPPRSENLRGCPGRENGAMDYLAPLFYTCARITETRIINPRAIYNPWIFDSAFSTRCFTGSYPEELGVSLS